MRRADRIAQERARLAVLIGRLEQSWRIEPSDVQIGRGVTSRYVSAGQYGRYVTLARELRQAGTRGGGTA